MDKIKRRNKDEDKLMLSAMIDDVINNPNRLGAPLFNKVAKIIPVVAVEIILYNNLGQMFLSYREDENFVGWHFPGRILRMGNNPEDELKKVLEYEIGITDVDYKFLFQENYHHSRGQEVCLIYLGVCDYADVGDKGSWFDAIPDDTLEQHKDMYRKAMSYV